jgi:alpha-tubulin suppressor-like RCC1 family protein
MRLRNGLPHTMMLASAIALLFSVACFEKSSVEPTAVQRTAPDSSAATLPALVVSDPFLPTQSASVLPSLHAAVHGEVAYVSLPSGTLLNAVSATIQNLSWDSPPSPPIAIVNGGFDPIAVDAAAGNQLELRITGAFGPLSIVRIVVPERRPPRVVRTNPPKGATDIPLNARVTVVFTEPVAPATVTSATVQLLHGTAQVPGTARVVQGSIFAAEFIPDEELAAGTTYRLVVKQGVRDTDGDSLDVEVTTDFTTAGTAPDAPRSSLVAGWGHTCALRSDGTMLCWGGNTFGQLGAGNDLLGVGNCPGRNAGSILLCSTTPVTVTGGRTFTSIASGFEHTCALAAGGDAYCWGASGKGHGGEEWPPSCDPSRGNCNCDPSEGTCNGVPLQVGGNVKFASIVAGYYHSCGLRIGGGAYCWGDELLTGGLGTGAGGIRRTPTAVIGSISFTSLASGAHHVCGLDTGGAAYCWGLNIGGQIGVSGGSSCDGPPTSNSFQWRCFRSPVRVSGGLTFVSLTAGWRHTCGLTSSGRAYCWGDFDLLNAGASSHDPRPVDNSLVFASLSNGAAASHTCGVTAANVAYCWGHNEEGMLGDGTTASNLSPVRVAGGLAFSSIVVGAEHSCGLTTAGILHCWGSNRAGQLGSGFASVRSLVPSRVVQQ